MLDILSAIISIASLVCFVLVVVKMFQNGQTGLGIGCIIGLCVCGIGGLVAFVYGWIKSSEWNLRPIMLIWTLCIVANIGISIVHTPSWVAQMQEMQRQQMK